MPARTEPARIGNECFDGRRCDRTDARDRSQTPHVVVALRLSNDLALELVDLLLQSADLVSKRRQGEACRCWQTLICCVTHDRDQCRDLHDTSRGDDAQFGQPIADCWLHTPGFNLRSLDTTDLMQYMCDRDRCTLHLLRGDLPSYFIDNADLGGFHRQVKSSIMFVAVSLLIQGSPVTPNCSAAEARVGFGRRPDRSASAGASPSGKAPIFRIRVRHLMAKKILVIADQFVRGGMETQIADQVATLSRQGYQFWLAGGVIAEQFVPPGFQDVLAGLSLSADTRLADFRQSLGRLQDFVLGASIDFIHVHPFYAPAMATVVSQRTGIPYAMTLHGPISIQIGAGTAGMMLHHAVLPSVGEVFCVSEEARTFLHSISPRRGCLLPNSVDLPKRRKFSRKPAADWLLVSRLDSDKAPGICEFIRFVDSLGDSCEIVGDGSERKALQDLVDGIGASERVQFRGWVADIQREMSSYAYVAGMGRVALEALAVGMPILLVGYDGIKGFVRPDMIEAAAFSNFSGRGLPSLDHAKLAAELPSVRQSPRDYTDRAWVARNAASDIIWSRYHDRLQHVTVRQSLEVEAFDKAVRAYGDSEAQIWNDSRFEGFLHGLFENCFPSRLKAASQADLVRIVSHVLGKSVADGAHGDRRFGTPAHLALDGSDKKELEYLDRIAAVLNAD